MASINFLCEIQLIVLSFRQCVEQLYLFPQNQFCSYENSAFQVVTFPKLFFLYFRTAMQKQKCKAFELLNRKKGKLFEIYQ
jgi:hypothetical protein